MTSWYQTAWAAVHAHGAQQDVTELASLLAILDAELDPVRVIETGTARGGSAWAWAQLPTVKQIVTVDPAGVPAPGSWALAGCGITQVPADSTLPATRDHVRELIYPYQADLLVIDGAHDFESARADYELYAGLVRPGGVIVLHDTQGYPGRPDIETPALWTQLRKRHRSIELVAQPGGPCGTGIIWR